MKRYFKDQQSFNNNKNINNIFEKIFSTNHIKLFVRCNVWLSKIFGLMPWSVDILDIVYNLNINTYTNSKELPHSRWNKFYIILLVLIVTSLSGVAISTNNCLNKMEARPFEARFAEIIITMIETISIDVIWFLYLTRRQKMIAFRSQIKEIDMIIKNCATYNSVANVQGLIIILMNPFIIIFFIIFCFLEWEPSVVLIWCVPSLISAIILVQFSLFLNTICLRLKNINNLISKIGRIPEEFGLQIFSVTKWPIKNVMKVKQIKCAHIELCNACKQLISFYAFPALLSIIYFGHLFIFGSYSMSLKYFIKKKTIHITDLISDGLWIFMIMYPIVILIITVNDTANVMKKTGNIIHWILNSCTTTDILENELIEFSYELLNRKIEFNIYGLVSLDGSVLHPIFGSITYIVILIQFQLK